MTEELKGFASSADKTAKLSYLDKVQVKDLKDFHSSNDKKATLSYVDTIQGKDVKDFTSAPDKTGRNIEDILKEGRKNPAVRGQQNSKGDNLPD